MGKKKIIIEKARSGLSVCRLCDMSMEEGSDRLGAAMNSRYTSYCHPECFLKSFMVDKTPNNRGKCKLGCGQPLKKDQPRMGFQLDPHSTIWFHIKCCADFVEPIKDIGVTKIAGLDEVNDESRKQVAEFFPAAKSAPRRQAAVPAAAAAAAAMEQASVSVPVVVAAAAAAAAAAIVVDLSDPDAGAVLVKPEVPVKQSKKRATRTSAKPLAKPKDDPEGDGAAAADETEVKHDKKEVEEADPEAEADAAEEYDDEKGADRETDFGCMTVEELKAECKRFKISTWNKTKDELIQLLKDDLNKAHPSKEKTSEKEWVPPAEAEDDGEEAAEHDESEDKKPFKKQKTKKE